MLYLIIFLWLISGYSLSLYSCYMACKQITAGDFVFFLLGTPLGLFNIILVLIFNDWKWFNKPVWRKK